KRAEKLKIANKELIFQNDEKEKRAEELKIANKELIFQNDEKEKRAGELSIANIELAFQDEEKEKRAGELSIANKELVFQNEEKEKRAEELKIANIDIIERKRVEVELENAKKLAEDANQMKSVFLANMSHEIRTPLNAIVGFSSILKEKNQDNKVNTEYLDNIIQSSKVLLNLINDILDLSKVEAGRMVIDLQSVNLNNLIKEIQTIFLMKATEKGILINIQIADNIPENIITDEKFLRQILFNLIGNAVKFTHAGSVDIIIDIIPKKEEYSKMDLVISVKDSGIGIPDNQLTNIFEPFIQLDNKSSNKYGGTGLGLSITKRLTKLLDGTISVESKYGKGSVFSVSLFNIEIGDLNISNDMNIEKSWLKNIRFKNPILLIAEDVLSNRQVLKGYLETLNITIIETENGEDCISVARKNRPDIILMDMQMPVMDGYTAINILKLDKDLKNIPIIALTASGMKHEKDKFGSIANDYLLKPIYKYELVELLTKYLPYEQDIEIGKEIENISTQINTQEELPIETKVELNKKFMHTILKLQKSLNFDDLIRFGKELEMCTEKPNIIKDYCARLNDNIATFDTDKIYASLSELTILINK
ncbi:MAG: response regulator, partial [Candidatus Sericytochromatia bacterium]|nr:response regulator [Candidatus Sericytochromatia bacterium]